MSFIRSSLVGTQILGVWGCTGLTFVRAKKKSTLD